MEADSMTVPVIVELVQRIVDYDGYKEVLWKNLTSTKLQSEHKIVN